MGAADTPPALYLFGGPNGSGKTTFARAFLGSEAPSVRFLNADEIARGLSPFAPELSAWRAGRLLLEELASCLARGESFALESTLSGRTYLQTLIDAKRRGFLVHLHFIWAGSADVSVERVRLRVVSGGHNVPSEDIRRRHERSLGALPAWLALATSWRIWDNRLEDPVLLASSAKQTIEEAQALLADHESSKVSSST